MLYITHTILHTCLLPLIFNDSMINQRSQSPTNWQSAPVMYILLVAFTVQECKSKNCTSGR